jgi:MinD superfamily P-loop ATPase
MTPRPGDTVTSYYEASIDAEECTGCGLCADRCQMDAIQETDEAWEIVDGRCIGCGLCVAECPVDAITMEAKPGTVPPPSTFDDTLNQIGAERGLQ